MQWSTGPGFKRNTKIYKFGDSGKRTPYGYKIYSVAAGDNIKKDRKKTNYIYETPQLEKLKLNVSSNSENSLLGSKYCVFANKSDAETAAKAPAGSSERMGSTANGQTRIGTIALKSNGEGWLRTGSVPSYSELVSSDDDHEYFSRDRKGVTLHLYYLVQFSAPEGYETDNTVYEFKRIGTTDNGSTELYKLELKAIETSSAASNFKIGDVSCDGSIRSEDAEALQNYITNGIVPEILKIKEDVLVLDMDDNKRVNIADVTYLKKYINGSKPQNCIIGTAVEV